jgi:ribosome-associated heat shock protein Hsp15
MPDDTRIDHWLCAVRLVKNRPMATQLCDGGHVRVNGNPAKPSTKVRAGDVVHALIAERERIVEVVRPIETRAGAPAAATCYVDNSPPPVTREIAPGIRAVRGEGRPSKRLRRELERMRRAGPRLTLRHMGISTETRRRRRSATVTVELTVLEE